MMYEEEEEEEEEEETRWRFFIVSVCVCGRVWKRECVFMCKTGSGCE